MAQLEKPKRKKRKLTSSKGQMAHDHSAELKRLSRIKGQVVGIERMIQEKRYCPEIVMQVKAARSALKSLELSIIENHMKHCVKTAVASKNSDVIQEKMDEILLLLKGHN
jgi:DNA-binding FrmR family transcriptional regulator